MADAPVEPPVDHRQAADPERDVFVADEQRDVELDLTRFAALAAFTLTAEKVRPDAELALTFVNESTMADLHERFLGLEGPTDVLAFPMDEELLETGRQPDQGGRGPGAPPDQDDVPLLVGDVVVCPAVAQRQARERGHSVEDELDLLVVHGVLHLLEYDHDDEGEAVEMRRREQAVLDGFRRSRAS